MLRRFHEALDQLDEDHSAPLRNELARFASYSSYGGAPLLGMDGAVVIGHGRSNPEAVCNGLEVAHRFETAHINEAITEAIARLSTET